MLGGQVQVAGSVAGADEGHPRMEGSQGRQGEAPQHLQEGPALLAWVLVSRKNDLHPILLQHRLPAARGDNRLQGPQESCHSLFSPLPFKVQMRKACLVALSALSSELPTLGKSPSTGTRSSYSRNLCDSVPSDLLSQHRQRTAWLPWEAL